MEFTDAEKEILKSIVFSISDEQRMGFLLAVLPILISMNHPIAQTLLTALNTNATLVQARIDALDAVKIASQATLTAQKQAMDSLISKITG